MKISLLTTTALGLSIAGNTQAFSIPSISKRGDASKLLAGSVKQQHDWVGPVAVTAMGWALASQVAVASMVLPGSIDNNNNHQLLQQPSSTLQLAVEQLDFSLPTYGSSLNNQGGFGQGTEARLGMTDSMVDPGSNEKAKQEEAMKKAEEARLARKRAEKELKKQREEDQIRAAEAKKEADKKRVAELFGG